MDPFAGQRIARTLARTRRAKQPIGHAGHVVCNHTFFLCRGSWFFGIDVFLFPAMNSETPTAAKRLPTHFPTPRVADFEFVRRFYASPVSDTMKSHTAATSAEHPSAQPQHLQVPRKRGRHLLTLLTALPLWAAGMFIHLFSYQVRGEVVHVHVHSLYNWIPALLREPRRVFTESDAFLAIITYAIPSVLHVAVCYLVASCLVRIFQRRYFRPRQ